MQPQGFHDGPLCTQPGTDLVDAHTSCCSSACRGKCVDVCCQVETALEALAQFLELDPRMLVLAAPNATHQLFDFTQASFWCTQQASTCRHDLTLNWDVYARPGNVKNGMRLPWSHQPCTLLWWRRHKSNEVLTADRLWPPKLQPPAPGPTSSWSRGWRWRR